MDVNQTYLRRCSQKGLVIDTNLLALLLIGSTNPGNIINCTRTSGYTPDDFRAVYTLAEKACKIIVTPQILAEVSNITFDIRHSGGFSAYFKQVVDFVVKSEEHHRDKDILTSTANLGILGKLGFADTSIVNIVREHDFLVLTDDGPLTNVLTSLQHDVININHLRSALWLKDI